MPSSSFKDSSGWIILQRQTKMCADCVCNSQGRPGWKMKQQYHELSPKPLSQTSLFAYCICIWKESKCPNDECLSSAHSWHSSFVLIVSSGAALRLQPQLHSCLQCREKNGVSFSSDDVQRREGNPGLKSAPCDAGAEETTRVESGEDNLRDCAPPSRPSGQGTLAWCVRRIVHAQLSPNSAFELDVSASTGEMAEEAVQGKKTTESFTGESYVSLWVIGNVVADRPEGARRILFGLRD